MKIKQYKVEKLIATPVNPFNPYMPDSEIYKYNEFSSFAKAHTYATNAQEGVYDADCFGEVVWQINNYADSWDTCSAKRVKYIHNNKTMINGWGYKCRQFLPFNPIPKMETTELPSPENKYRVGRSSGTVILTVNGQTEIGRIHDPEMALRVCDFLNTAQPEPDYLYHQHDDDEQFEHEMQERAFKESEVISMLEALRQRCAEEATLKWIEDGKEKKWASKIYRKSDVSYITIDTSLIESIDVNQFIPPLTK